MKNPMVHLFIDNSQDIARLIKNILLDAEISIHEPRPTNHTFEREYGWYHQFNKQNKRKNFKK